MWHSSSYTETGKIRCHNEDAVLDLCCENLWVVADGMGGHSNGDYASQLVKQTLAGYLSSNLPGTSKNRLVRALGDCNNQLLEKATRDHVDVIGCTVASLQARDHSVLCSWSGDSRIYRFRQGRLMQLTQDHSQQSAMEDRDRIRYPIAPTRASPMLTKAIGGNLRLELEHCWYALKSDDTFLLCTDGLNKEVSDEEIKDALHLSNNGDEALSYLTGLYQKRGASDNIGLVWARKAP